MRGRASAGKVGLSARSRTKQCVGRQTSRDRCVWVPGPPPVWAGTTLSKPVSPGPRSLSNQPPPLDSGREQGQPCTYLLGQTARKQAGPGEEKGRQKNGVPPRAAGDRSRVGEGRNAQGVGQRQKQQRHTQSEWEGGREGERGKKTSYIHMRIGQALSLPRMAEGPEPHQGSHEHLCQCLAPTHLPGHVPSRPGGPSIAMRLPRRSPPQGRR